MHHHVIVQSIVCVDGMGNMDTLDGTKVNNYECVRTIRALKISIVSFCDKITQIF